MRVILRTFTDRFLSEYGVKFNKEATGGSRYLLVKKTGIRSKAARYHFIITSEDRGTYGNSFARSLAMKCSHGSGRMVRPGGRGCCQQAGRNERAKLWAGVPWVLVTGGRRGMFSFLSCIIHKLDKLIG